MRALTVSLLIVLVCACRPPTGDGSTSASSGASTSGAASSSSSGTTDACDGSNDCDSEGLCVAEYVPADTVGGERGPAHCVDASACIGELDLGRWCFDHPSCCEGLRCRKIDGICETPDLGESTDESASTSGDPTTGTSGDTDTGTSTGTSTGGDTDTDTDTDTDGTTGTSG